MEIKKKKMYDDPRLSLFSFLSCEIKRMPDAITLWRLFEEKTFFVVY